MPPKKETALQKSIRHSIQSAVSAMKADKALVTAAMNQSPSCVTRLKKLLRDLGYIDEKDCIIERHEAPTPKCESANAGSPNSKLDYGLCDELPEGVVCLGDCDSPLLGFLLSRCEEVAFSKHSLKALLKRNQRKISKEPLLEMIEFATDMPKDLNIQSCATIGNLADLLTTKNEDNGRRARDLRLPAVWSKPGVGVFSVVFEGGRPFLTERFRNTQSEIKVPELLQNYSEDPKEWVITNNFSMSRASLGRAGVVSALVPCLSILPQAAISMKKPKRLAIRDGEAPSAPESVASTSATSSIALQGAADQPCETPPPKRARSDPAWSPSVTSVSHGLDARSPAVGGATGSQDTPPVPSPAETEVIAPPEAPSGGAGAELDLAFHGADLAEE